MKQTTAGPGRYAIEYSIPIITALVGKVADVRITAGGILLHHFHGVVPPIDDTVNPERTIRVQSKLVLASTVTVQMDITVDGAGIQANREGTLLARVVA